MKKLLLLFIALPVLFTSCESDDINPSEDSNFIDTTLLNITEVVNKILKQYSEISVKNV